MSTFSTIEFGDYLTVTDEGGGTIRVDGCPPGGGGIQFNFDNEGGYLSVVTNAPNPGPGLTPYTGSLVLADLGGSGFQLLGSGGIDIYNDHTATFSPLSWLFIPPAEGVTIIANTASTAGGSPTLNFQFAGANGDFVSFAKIYDPGTEYARIGQGGVSAVDFNELGSTGLYINEFSGSGINLDAAGGFVFEVRNANDFDIQLLDGPGGTVRIRNLPTSNPGGSGKLWNNGGVLNIT